MLHKNYKKLNSPQKSRALNQIDRPRGDRVMPYVSLGQEVAMVAKYTLAFALLGSTTLIVLLLIYCLVPELLVLDPASN